MGSTGQRQLSGKVGIWQSGHQAWMCQVHRDTGRTRRQSLLELATLQNQGIMHQMQMSDFSGHAELDHHKELPLISSYSSQLGSTSFALPQFRISQLGWLMTYVESWIRSNMPAPFTGSRYSEWTEREPSGPQRVEGGWGREHVKLSDKSWEVWAVYILFHQLHFDQHSFRRRRPWDLWGR